MSESANGWTIGSTSPSATSCIESMNSLIRVEAEPVMIASLPKTNAG